MNDKDKRWLRKFLVISWFIFFLLLSALVFMFSFQLEKVNMEVQRIKSTQPVNGIDGKDGRDGTDGSTPVSGVDYFDGVQGPQGQPGETGAKGEPGNDGADGRTPIPCKLADGTVGYKYTNDRLCKPVGE